MTTLFPAAASIPLAYHHPAYSLAQNSTVGRYVAPYGPIQLDSSRVIPIELGRRFKVLAEVPNRETEKENIMKFEVSKQLKVVYTLEAEGPDAALAAEPPADAAITVLRQKAKDLDKQPSAGRPAIVDRELRPGRKLIARYKKVDWIAEVQADGQIALRKKGGSHAETFPTLAKAAMHLIDGKAVNCWMLFRDAPAAEGPKRSKGKTDEGETEQQQS